MVKLAGNEDVGTFTPTQLYAGEADIVTTQGVISSGQDLADYTVLAKVGGEYVAYNKEGVDGSELPSAVLPHAMDTSATGLNADADSPIIIGGVLNFDLLVADGQTYEALRAAFMANNSNIVIQKLY